MTAPSFGARVRAERERKCIRLETIARDTKISIALFEALERNDVSRWPSGIFRRAFIRAYADAIGLEAAPLLAEFLDEFPDPADPPASDAASSGAPADTLRRASPAAPLRLTLAAEAKSGFLELRAIPERVAAAACDVGAVTFLGLTVALAGGVWPAVTAAAISYFVAGQLALGSSPGAWVARRAPGGILQRVSLRATLAARGLQSRGISHAGAFQPTPQHVVSQRTNGAVSHT